MPQLSLLLPGAWPEPVCNPLLEARAAPPPGRKRQTHTSRPCPRALLFRAAEQIAAAREARARRGEGREARALARRRAWQLSPARETSRRVRRSKAAGELLHVCLRAQRAPASEWIQAGRAANPLSEGRGEAECEPPRGGAAAWSTAGVLPEAGEQTRGQGRQAAELRWEARSGGRVSRNGNNSGLRAARRTNRG